MNVPLDLDFLKSEPGVTWILPKSSICLPSLFLYLSGQTTKRLAKSTSGSRFQSFSGSSSLVSPRRCSARASSASRPRASPDSSNNFDQRRSDSSSLRSHRASSSCVSAGSAETRANASSRSRVMFSSPSHGSAGMPMRANRRPTPRFSSVARPVAVARRRPKSTLSHWCCLRDSPVGGSAIVGSYRTSHQALPAKHEAEGVGYLARSGGVAR